MCGIVGFVGKKQAAPILLEGLSKLEYRGYDSAGIAVRDGQEPAEVVKATGVLANLKEKTDDGKSLVGSCGIGHTRWATHGGPSQINAHPHVSGNCKGSASGPVESNVVEEVLKRFSPIFVAKRYFCYIVGIFKHIAAKAGYSARNCYFNKLRTVVKSI